MGKCSAEDGRAEFPSGYSRKMSQLRFCTNQFTPVPAVGEEAEGVDAGHGHIPGGVDGANELEPVGDSIIVNITAVEPEAAQLLNISDIFNPNI